MPFNKGDFTQQGVNGHVNATVRLNEKRLVNIDMTSNEASEGCTITGTVKDLLNDKVYGIGSGVSGNIEITENGENINVAQYATATVNVAGGGGYELYDLTVTLVNSSTNPITAYRFPGLQIQEYEGQTVCGVGLNSGSMYPNDDPITSVSQIIKSDLMVWTGDVRLTAGDVLTISNEINCSVTWDENSTLQAFITDEHASFTRTVSNS